MSHVPGRKDARQNPLQKETIAEKFRRFTKRGHLAMCPLSRIALRVYPLVTSTAETHIPSIWARRNRSLLLGMSKAC